jgi:hypothetical protein
LKISEGEEEFEDIRGRRRVWRYQRVIRNYNSKDGQHIGPKKG